MEPTSNRTATASVDDSVIRIRIPARWPKEEGLKAFLRLQKRIFRRLEKNPSYFSRPKPLEFFGGQEIEVWGKRFIIKKQIGNGKKSSSAKLSGNEIIIRLAAGLPEKKEQQILSNLARRVIVKAVLPDIEKCLHALNDEHFQGKLRKVFIKENKTSFGSCSVKGNINLSFRILFAPKDVFNYLAIHELAHLKQHNHSSAFWALVEKAMPDYKEHRKWLKNNGNSIGPSAGNIVSNEIKIGELQGPIAANQQLASNSESKLKTEIESSPGHKV